MKVSRSALKLRFIPLTCNTILLFKPASFHNLFQDFIETLDGRLIKRLCIRSLHRGVGFMDFIHGLLIMEDDLDDDDNADNSTGDTPTSSAPQDTPVSGADPDPQTPDGSASPPWCKCSKCRVMLQDRENKCCGQRRCVTTHARFTKLCLNPDVLQLAVRDRGGFRNDREDNSARSFRKSVLDGYGHLGKGNRKVCPSCEVLKVRQNYPSQTGVYMGFRPE